MGCKTREDVAVVAIGVVFGVGKVGFGAMDIAVAQPLHDLVYGDDFARVIDRQGAQRDGIEEGENGRIHADAEGQGEHGDQREAGGFAKQAKAVAKVLQEHGHPEISLGGSTAIGAAMFPVF